MGFGEVMICDQLVLLEDGWVLGGSSGEVFLAGIEDVSKGLPLLIK